MELRSAMPAHKDPAPAPAPWRHVMRGKNSQSEASGNEDIICGLGRRGRRRSNLIYSLEPRPLVPSEQSRAQHALFIQASKEGKVVEILEAERCSNCAGLRPSNVPLTTLNGVIEFGSGSVQSPVNHWWCHNCKRGCVVDGRPLGLVM